MFIFEVGLVLKMKYNSCLLALSWIEIRHKTKHCQGNNLSIFFIKYKENSEPADKKERTN